MKEVIVVSEKAVSAPKFEVKLVGELAPVLSSVFLILETESKNEMIVKRVNAKSLIGVLSLELKGGEQVIVQAVGDDEAEAVKAVKRVLC